MRSPIDPFLSPPSARSWRTYNPFSTAAARSNKISPINPYSTPPPKRSWRISNLFSAAPAQSHGISHGSPDVPPEYTRSRRTPSPVSPGVAAAQGFLQFRPLPGRMTSFQVPRALPADVLYIVPAEIRQGRQWPNAFIAPDVRDQCWSSSFMRETEENPELLQGSSPGMRTDDENFRSTRERRRRSCSMNDSDLLIQSRARVQPNFDDDLSLPYTQDQWRQDDKESLLNCTPLSSQHEDNPVPAVLPRKYHEEELSLSRHESLRPVRTEGRSLRIKIPQISYEQQRVALDGLNKSPYNRYCSSPLGITQRFDIAELTCDYPRAVASSSPYDQARPSGIEASQKFDDIDLAVRPPASPYSPHTGAQTTPCADPGNSKCGTKFLFDRPQTPGLFGIKNDFGPSSGRSIHRSISSSRAENFPADRHFSRESSNDHKAQPKHAGRPASPKRPRMPSDIFRIGHLAVDADSPLRSPLRITRTNAHSAKIFREAGLESNSRLAATSAGDDDNDWETEGSTEELHELQHDDGLHGAAVGSSLADTSDSGILPRLSESVSIERIRQPVTHPRYLEAWNHLHDRCSTPMAVGSEDIVREGDGWSTFDCWTGNQSTPSSNSSSSVVGATLLGQELAGLPPTNSSQTPGTSLDLDSKRFSPRSPSLQFTSAFEAGWDDEGNSGAPGTSNSRLPRNSSS